MDINMRDLTTQLLSLGIKAEYIMSGGGCGTIYIGDANEDGFYSYAIGPSNYSTGMTTLEDLVWGIDGDENNFFTVNSSTLAMLIATHYDPFLMFMTLGYSYNREA